MDERRPPAGPRDPLARRQRWLLALLDRVAGTSSATPATDRRLARTVAASLLVGSVAAALLALVYASIGAPLDALVGLTCSFTAASILAAWRLTGRAEVATHGTMAAFVVIFCVAAHLTHSTAYLSWVAVIVLVAFYSGGLKLGVAWSAATVVCLAVAGLTAGPVSDLGLQPDHTHESLVSFLRAVSLVPVIALLGAAYEVTRLDYIRELEFAHRRAEQANAARARLLTKVSHEIRTPLNGILGLTEATLLGELPSQARVDIEAVRGSGKVLLSLVNDLLDVARAEAGRLQVAAEPLCLRGVVESVAALHRPSASQKALSLEVSETGAGRTYVLGDEVRLQQVVGNLVSNAIKFTPSGSVRVELHTEPVADAPGRVAVSLWVRDTGLGMSETDRAQLFTPFFQVRAEDQHHGTGLGLAICQELVQRMGGVIDVESTLGRGSSFRVRLTLDEAPPSRHRRHAPPLGVPVVDTVPVRAPEPTPPSDPPVRSRPIAALVIDDNAVNLRVAAALLKRVGVTVTLANSGAEALVKARGGAFDVVFTDLQMPELDGFETARALRAEGFVGPIYAITASAEPATAEACAAAGLDGCLTKPVSLAAFWPVVERVANVAAAGFPKPQAQAADVLSPPS